MPLVIIKDFKVLIVNKPFFDRPVKSKQENAWKLAEILGNDDYTTWNFMIICTIKLIGIDFFKTD